MPTMPFGEYALMCQHAVDEAFEKQMDLAVRLHNRRLEGVSVTDDDIALMKEIMKAQKDSHLIARELATMALEEMTREEEE